MNVLKRASPETLQVLRSLRSALSTYASRRGDRVEVRYKTGWISLRSVAASRVFAEVRPGKKGLEVFLLPPKTALRDSHGLAAPVPPSRGWGWFRTRVKIENGRSPGWARDLLQQSYEYARRSPRRRAQRRAQRHVRRGQKYS